ncbi:MAG: hypothetical protein OEZ65_13205 [Gemmatimonadota bacterium]|nr:hypothetical protein [Gemmatimonadota bacterium]
MSVDTAMKSAMASVPGALAAGIVDMGSGMLVGIKTVDSHPQAVLDVLASATKEIFEGQMVTQIENLFKKARGVESNERYFKEILVSSTNLWHYFGRLKKQPNAVLGIVAGGDTNVGLFLMKARAICESETL